MQIDLKTHHVALTEDLREHVQRRVGFALSRFSDRIARITVRIGDVNGPRGGLDTSCQAAAEMVDGRVIRVAGVWVDARTAASACLERLRAAVSHDVERRRSGMRRSDRHRAITHAMK